MRDLCYSLGILIPISLIGIPLSRLLAASHFPSRLLAAPVFGLGAVSILIAAAYRRDLSLRSAALLTLVAALIIGGREVAVAWRNRRSLPRRRVFLTAATAFAVLLSCLAPMWTGGARYTSFQGNPHDHVRYMTHVSAARITPYSVLESGTFENPVLIDGHAFMNGRPAPQLTLAAYSLAFGADTIQATYPYLAALQTFTFFGLAFLILQVVRCRFEIALLSAAAGAVGFPMQYIFDINAWGKLAGMPAALASTAIFLTTIAPLSEPVRGRRLWSLAAAISLIVGSLVYLYPEMLPVYGAGVIAAIAAWAWLNRGRRTFDWLAPCAIGLVGALLVCLPYLEGTLQFFIRELGFAANRPVNWWRYFQAYLINGGPVDFVVSALGLYFLLPPPSVTGAMETAWRLAAHASTAIILLLSTAAWMRLSRRSQRAALLLVSVAGATLVIVITAFAGRYWPAGEAWAMLAPLTYAALVMPLFDVGAPWPNASRRAALFVVVYHLALGVARPIAVMREEYPYYPHPYPSPTSHHKRDYDWDVHRHAEKIAACESIGLDIDDTFLERTWAIYLTDHHRTWETARPKDQSFSRTRDARAEPLRDDLDCVVSTRYGPPLGRKSTILLSSADARLGDFLTGAAPELDFALFVSPSIETSGLYTIETYDGESLRWTSGDARLAIPRHVARLAKRLELTAWPFAAHTDRTVRVTVNDRVLFEGPSSLALDGLDWDIAGDSELDIRIVVPPHHVPRDPRSLGIALRRLALVR